jgi:hypothetical protein
MANFGVIANLHRQRLRVIASIVIADFLAVPAGWAWGRFQR